LLRKQRKNLGGYFLPHPINFMLTITSTSDELSRVPSLMT